MIVFPNAKINIGLQVVGKRPDGYHELETVFYPIPLYDVLEVVDRQPFYIFETGLSIPSGAENICEKVCSVLADEFDLPPFHLHLHKAIPMGAGLGGGSADAAFLIKLLNDYCKLGMSVARMQDVARMLGADCAFFIENRPVYATGRGDRFEALDLDLSSYSVVIIKPDIHISTAEAFSRVDVNKDGRSLREHIGAPIEDWHKLIVNDFEAGVFDRYPMIKFIKDQLYQAGAIYASMSGTGSALFGIFEKGVTLPDLANRYELWYC